VPYVRSETVTTQRTASGSAAPGAVAVQPGEVATEAGPAGAGGATVDPVTGSTTRSGPPSAAPAGANGPGVTDDSIKLGIAIIDVGAASQLGYSFDLGNQRARYDALIADQNAKGGINGRKLVAEYHTIDSAAHPVETQQAACVHWTQDAKVFAVLAESTFSQAAAVCITGQGKTPFFSTDGFDETYYASGLYYSTQASDNRILSDHVDYLQSKGRLAGKTIGVLVGDGSERVAVDRTLLPKLQSLGYSVKRIEVVPQTLSGTQKISIAVSNLKAAGVDLLIMATGVIIAGPFAQSADRAGYHPELALSDFNNQINDQVATYYPDGFDGTVAISTHTFPLYRAGRPVPPADQACFDRVAAADPKVLPFQNSAHEVGLGECAMFDAFVGAASKAGPVLNSTTLRQGAATMRSFPIAGTYDGSFGPNKRDAVDFEQEVAWRRSCKCWQIVPGAPLRRMT
jgi:ABC-type branched-subunit amino acid transport system substrate-binding protein